MNKIVIAIVLTLAVAAAGGWYVYSQRGGESMMSASDSAQAARGSMKDLMAHTASKCTVTNSTANSDSSGTVYVGEGKMSADFTTVTKSPALTIESHMISDGEFIYTWSDAMTQGMKIPVTSANMSGQPNAPKSEQVELYNADVAYDCDSWRVDESRFEVPESVTFVDMSTMMPGAATGAPESGNNGSMNPPSKSVQCNMCDSLTEPQRSQCRSALQCR